jgi:two-component sensor histidine kinase
MQLLYEKLMLASDYDSINLKSYIEELAAAVLALKPDDSVIRLITDFDEIYLDSKKLFVIGIIVNELLTNSMKYAFPNGDGGTIKISAKKLDDKICLTVKDDGVGYSELELEKRGQGKVGMDIIKVLVQELDGNLDLKSGKGVTASIVFKAGGEGLQ